MNETNLENKLMILQEVVKNIKNIKKERDKLVKDSLLRDAIYEVKYMNYVAKEICGGNQN